MSFWATLLHRNSQQPNFAGYVDHHSHILPGVDDGFATIEDSLACLDFYENLGVTKLWLTPHIMEDFPNTTDSLRQKFSRLNDAYNGNIELHLAAENMIDPLFVSRLDQGDLLPMDDMLLVETSYYNPPENFHQILDEIKSKGYYPLLAHPERYIYMTDSDYSQLLANGIKFQLNIFSLTGMYGQQPKEKALRLLKQNAYTYSGSDIHNLRQTQAFSNLRKDSSLCKKILNI